MKPTEQQEAIISHKGNSVIIAAPGSGKTFVVSEKIRILLKELKEYQGVIAISYTNKASNELQARSLKNGIDAKFSFFGTIDRFCNSEIIIPFGKHLFGKPKSEVKIVTKNQLSNREKSHFSWLNRDTIYANLTVTAISILREYFLKGILLIDSVGVLACYIFSNSAACRHYLKARYKYIIIDEYQDSGVNQHSLFLKINELGIVAIAVGDINQSIYAFSGKNSIYLTELTNRHGFSTFPLNKNHRCHSSIINYSNFLLNSKTELLDVEEKRIYFQKITGAEVEIAAWIDEKLLSIKEKFSLTNNNQIAILTRNNLTARLIHNNLTTDSKLILTTSLDQSMNVWSGIFSNLLKFVYSHQYKFIEVVEEFTTYDDIPKPKVRELVGLKQTITTLFNSKNVLDIPRITDSFRI